MLTFFRKIRKGLLGSGQARKYLLYAIGEILLVMIGILLALQVNNWNINRQDRLKETILIKSLYDELLVNEEYLKSLVKDFKNDNETSAIYLLNAMEMHPDDIPIERH